MGLGGFLSSIAGTVLGGLIGKKGAEKSADAVRAAGDANAALQREFAQQGVRWKVEDAAAAGIHPLYALGANVNAAAPAYVGEDPVGRFQADWGLQMGQDLTRAIHATRTQSEREKAFETLKLEHAALQNDYLRAQIGRLNSAQVGAPFPEGDVGNFMPGQSAGRSLVINEPLRRVVSSPGRPAQEVGWIPDVAYSRTDNGLSPRMPEILSESYENDILGSTLWRIRNQVLPNIGMAPPSDGDLPKGAKEWRWFVPFQEWRPWYGPSWRDYLMIRPWKYMRR